MVLRSQRALNLLWERGMSFIATGSAWELCSVQRSFDTFSTGGVRNASYCIQV